MEPCSTCLARLSSTLFLVDIKNGALRKIILPILWEAGVNTELINDILNRCVREVFGGIQLDYC